MQKNCFYFTPFNIIPPFFFPFLASRIHLYLYPLFNVVNTPFNLLIIICNFFQTRNYDIKTEAQLNVFWLGRLRRNNLMVFNWNKRFFFNRGGGIRLKFMKRGGGRGLNQQSQFIKCAHIFLTYLTL